MQVRLPADKAKQTDAVFFRQHHIQQHQLGNGLLQCLTEGRGFCKTFRLKACLPQGIKLQLPNTGVIFHHVDHCNSSPL